MYKCDFCGLPTVGAVMDLRYCFKCAVFRRTNIYTKEELKPLLRYDCCNNKFK